ncbi:MAG TPA: hypothetical protein VHV54_22320 [Candidatus Binatia bacterium]|nr:hypothetical protein [Candidatus Binatia bacterium]
MEVKERVTQDLQEIEQAIAEICGAKVKYEVAWDSFGNDEMAMRQINRVCGYPVKRAVQIICRGEFGKGGLSNGFKSIKVTNSVSPAETALAFRNGVLEIHCHFANSPALGWEAVRDILEKNINTQPSAAFGRFLKSLTIGLEEWREGTGYDLSALGEMTPDERAAIERKLIEHLADPGDWRDVEALAALATPTALAAVEKARKHPDSEVREHAIEHVLEKNPQDPKIEADVVRAVKKGNIELAEQCPTPRVKRALLDCARTADATTRVNAAALLMYLCGQAAEPFDWKQRPFFLRFGEEDPKERRAALKELREKTGL